MNIGMTMTQYCILDSVKSILIIIIIELYKHFTSDLKLGAIFTFFFGKPARFKIRQGSGESRATFVLVAHQ